ncbi:uncharacterized protein LOC132544042 [Ylistrum balloti]|uniref:uncharacterized protein LOC132544042 n=1 Tax=Ylistrum balloti TaxID=509963 RepID=UPI002905AA6B|nr:uncharacterized protein LOC132544042 [Ylistrum balloti]
MNILIIELVVELLLVASGFSIPIIKKNTEDKYNFPPNFSETTASTRDENTDRISQLSVMEIQPNTEVDTDQRLSIPSPKSYTNTALNSDMVSSENSYTDGRSQLSSLRLGGSASLHFRFWKSVSKTAIPLVKFLGNSLERLVLNHCKDNNDVIPDDCLDFSFNLVNNWNVRDFIRSPSNEVMMIKKQKRFNKKLLIDVIQVLRYHWGNLTDLLAIEKRHICGSEAVCDVDCTLGSSLYCSLNGVIVPQLDELILGLEKEAKMYYGAKISQQTPERMNPEKVRFYSKYRVFYVLGTMYNIMLQMFETEAALSYILDFTKVMRLQVR